ncbi:hypothetical protein DAPPUDRAFT_309279 [Daphnia pulex]|uniref:Uncharacterized protein n=1 Tax=Daphnia pulex TaxID=6669 RepID=E9HBH0_DAPPU|nr:hypothetical protein DAPPUDRAFT_309279 [Daphnia pulex]|eukprot:EFX70840.1 hypothetical protein DAPPUDRAFT_309279 [Daphnia pulex]
MGNRRDALKHSKAVSSSTESNSPTKSKEEKKPTDGEADKTEGEGGLTAWLSSSEGVGWMQFFVVTNAIILLLTTGLPRIWETLDFMTSSSSSD